jgi:hypothetical protein
MNLPSIILLIYGTNARSNSDTIKTLLIKQPWTNKNEESFSFGWNYTFGLVFTFILLLEQTLENISMRGTFLMPKSEKSCSSRSTTTKTKREFSCQKEISKQSKLGCGYPNTFAKSLKKSSPTKTGWKFVKVINVLLLRTP